MQQQQTQQQLARHEVCTHTQPAGYRPTVTLAVPHVGA
jgi:hypothetical protein